MNAILLDAAVIVILLISLTRGYRKGMVLTLAGLVGTFVALFGAVYLSNKLLQPVTGFLAPMLENSLRSYLDTLSLSASSGTGVSDLDALLEALSESPVLIRIVETVQAAMGDVVAQTTDALITAVSLHLAASVARIVLFVLAFAVVSFLFNLLARSLDLAFHLPLLNAVNRWTGAAFGLLKGGLLVFILAWLLEGHFLSPEVIESTKLFHLFCNVNLLAVIGQIGLPKP